ncbi:MAG: ABC transporter ATP-binding protein/permease [Verrucomicrobiales bacterium]|jgi:ABC-type multidrug transport system fused ATPase/permease subunit|nr:ABC transporter ATP-binding protein/permease [Verrucomicrobiales bacterium]
MKGLGRVFAYCGRYPWLAAGMLLCAVLATASGILYPKLTGLIVDDVIAGQRADRLWWMCGAVLASFFLRDFLSFARLRFNNSFEQSVIFNIRTQLYDHLQRLPLAWFDDQASGDLMTRVSEDVTNMERVLIDGIEQGTIAVLQILGVGAVLFWMNPALAWYVVLPLPLLAAGVIIYTRLAFQKQRLVRRATSAMNALLLDNLQGILQIKSFGREKRELRHFSEKAAHLKTVQLNAIWIWTYYSPTMSFISASGIVLVLFFGGRQVMSGGFSVGELTSFLLYVNLFYNPMEKLHQLNTLFQSGRAAAERVFKILDTPAEADNVTQVEVSGGQNTGRLACATLPPLTVSARRVEFVNISFAYETDRAVLRNINLSVAPGKTIAFVGPTGAGKSTIVGLIPRFYRVADGQLLIDSVPVNDIPLEELRAQIGIVSQESFLFNATVRDNLLFGKPDADDERLRAALSAANALTFVEKLPRGLDTHVGENGVKLSVGEKQRLSFARALLKDPPILILDEATASVDTATERLIQEALEHLLKNRTSFVIAHRLSTIQKADLICVVKHGEIIERGTHNELLAADGLYAALCRAQTLGETAEQAFEQLGE